MYQNSRLKNSFIFAYVMWFFGLLLLPLLFIKVHISLVIIFEVLNILILASLIYSHTQYNKNYQKYSLLAFIGICGFNLMTIIGLVYEIILSLTNNNGGIYIWFILILLIISSALISIFFALDYKNHQKAKVENNTI